MQPVLRVLDDICYVLECAATNCMGEGKSELNALCVRLEGSDEASAVPEREHLAARLREIMERVRSSPAQPSSPAEARDRMQERTRLLAEGEGALARRPPLCN